MVTGISFDFHNLAISWVSESSQWWRPMAAVVIFGLLIATFLTLVVVPTLYSLVESGRIRASQELLEAAQKAPGQWLAKYRVTVEIENETKPALVAETLVLYIAAA